MTAAEPPPGTEPATRVIAMPADANPDGDIFGGWLLCQMDLAAYAVASERAGGRTVTIAIDSMAFLRPVRIGDEVTVYAHLVRAGRTSMRVSVEAWRRTRDRREKAKVTEGAFTLVAIDEEGRPRPVAVDG